MRGLIAGVLLAACTFTRSAHDVHPAPHLELDGAGQRVAVVVAPNANVEQLCPLYSIEDLPRAVRGAAERALREARFEVVEPGAEGAQTVTVTDLRLDCPPVGGDNLCELDYRSVLSNASEPALGTASGHFEQRRKIFTPSDLDRAMERLIASAVEDWSKKLLSRPPPHPPASL